MIVFKCLLVTLLCIDGIIIPVVAEMGELATIISIFAGLGLSVLVLKNVKLGKVRSGLKQEIRLG